MHTERLGASADGDFRLLETMRLEDGCLLRLDRHLRRAAAAAACFEFAWREAAVRTLLCAVTERHHTGCWRCRLLIARDGVATVECVPHDDDTRAWRVALAAEPVDERDPFLFHKTTHRVIYDSARRHRPDVDDVLLWNRRGEVTESTVGNVVVELDGVRLTPPVACGLLAGTFRSELVEQELIVERVLTLDDVRRATRLWLTNSVRGWVQAALVR
jgi:para-aminobenzoate synthetase/4-amino-4-deoxychorismate lyase